MRNLKLKRVASLLLAVLMLFGLMVEAAFAAGTTDETAIDMSSSPSAVSNKSLDDVKAILEADSYPEYYGKLSNTDRGTDKITIDALDCEELKNADEASTENSAKQNSEALHKEDNYNGEKNVLYTPENGVTTWKFSVEKAGLYTLTLNYCAAIADEEESYSENANIERILRINGDIPYAELRYLTLMKNWVDLYNEDTENGFDEDSSGNELRPQKKCVARWQDYTLTDSTGYYTGTMQFYLEAGENTVSLQATREDCYLKSLTIHPTEEAKTYEEYLSYWQKKGAKEASADAVSKVEAEHPCATSSSTIYPTYDRSSPITSPQDTTKIRYNTLGNASTWTTIGTWVEWEMTVPEDGLYNIYTRFRQTVSVDKFVSRCLYINGEIPFQEAQSLRFDYSDEWQVQALGNHKDADHDLNYLFYFEKGKTYTLRMEVVLGDMSTLLTSISELVTPLNNIYLKILQITGATPDSNRDYGFMDLIPDYLDEMLLQSKKLYEIVDQFVEINGYVGSEVKTLKEIAKLLHTMGSKETKIASNLANLKTDVGTLGTWIYNATEQPLELDYLSVQGTGAEEPQAKETAVQSMSYEFKQFIASFYSSYNSYSTGYSENSSDFVTLWFTGGRDQAQIYKRMLDDSFTPETGIKVEMKYTTDGAVLPAMLAGVGPDISGFASADCINWAIRGALLPIDFDDTDEVLKRFSPEASIPFTLYNYDVDTDSQTETLYAIPTNMSFNMMYYRMDVLADMGLEVPDTWDELRSMLPALQADHMDIGAPGYSDLYTIFLYQNNGEVYSDHGMRIGIDNLLNLSCFQDACEIYTQYDFPLTFDFTNRFRTGEMPIGFTSYTAVTTLNVFATEIRGLWEFTTIPGTFNTDSETGETVYNNVNTVAFTGTSILRGCGNKDLVWEYLKWWTAEPQQTRYGNEMESILGIGTRYETATIDSIKNQPWNTEEAAKITAQIDNLKSTPEYPGSYIIGRYLGFAFNHAYNDDADPVDTVLGYVNYINKEINRKRKEFDMDTLDIGKTLADVQKDNKSNE